MLCQQKKRGKKIQAERRCFACITLDNKVILKVSLIFLSDDVVVPRIHQMEREITQMEPQLFLHMVHFAQTHTHTHRAITHAASLLLCILSAVFWQQWWWSSCAPCGNNYCSRLFFLLIVAFELALQRSNLSHRTIVWHSRRNTPVFSPLSGQIMEMPEKKTKINKNNTMSATPSGACEGSPISQTYHVVGSSRVPLTCRSFEALQKQFAASLSAPSGASVEFCRYQLF